MSLIREALKKATVDREAVQASRAVAGAPPPSPAAAPAAPAPAPVAPAPPPPFAVAARPDPALVLAGAPRSTAAQQFENLRTHVHLALAGRPSRVVLVTSAVPGEGKSLTATNLALSLAGNGADRTVVVDGDLRTPRVHALLGVPRTLGLSDYLDRQAGLEAIVHRSPVERALVVPAGTGTWSPSNRLTSPRLRELIAELRTRFDDVVIDSPPLLALADARALAALADGVLVVVRAARTRRDLVAEAVGRLHGARVLGVVLNAAERSQIERHYGVYEGADAEPAGA
jgi:protein-tyrosine kinase